MLRFNDDFDFRSEFVGVINIVIFILRSEEHTSELQSH